MIDGKCSFCGESHNLDNCTKLIDFRLEQVKRIEDDYAVIAKLSGNKCGYCHRQFCVAEHSTKYIEEVDKIDAHVVEQMFRDLYTRYYALLIEFNNYKNENKKEKE